MRAHRRFPIAAKFGVMLGVLVVALFAVGAAGVGGLNSINSHVRGLYGDHIVTLERTTALADDSAKAAKIALQLIVSNDPREISALEQALNRAVVPHTNADFEALRTIHAHDPRAERAQLEQLEGLWSRFVSFLNDGRLRVVVNGSAGIRQDESLARELRAIFDPIEEKTHRQVSLEGQQSSAVARESGRSYGSSRDTVIVIALLAIVLGAGVMALVIRAVVPRIRRYSDFATRVAGGETNGGVAIEGNDELSDLGLALNDMVARRIAERDLEAHQSEFAEVMQLTETEDEAHTLLKRQIERLIPDSEVVTLNRNNSADRLQATTEVSPDSPLLHTLEGAKPRSCLAVRFARTHVERPGSEPLVSCEICGNSTAFSTCEPLLVGGEVIGSVLASRPREFGEVDALTIKQSVTQAAPVLANLRNLAIAEMRAATDALTGLPNNRNVADTVKRMVAQASRAVAPLAALALDLDHFKRINDTYGHASGDDVLAAVGSTLTGAIRASDFVGRAGGEEFLILLPETGLEPAQVAAENLRAAIAAVVIPSIDRPITASIGVAVFPDQAGDAASLLRHADRALYVAKKNGRNRVETFAREMLPNDGARESTKTKVSADVRVPAGAGNRASGPARRSRART